MAAPQTPLLFTQTGRSENAPIWELLLIFQSYKVEIWLKSHDLTTKFLFCKQTGQMTEVRVAQSVWLADRTLSKSAKMSLRDTMCFHTPKSVCWIRCVNLGQQHTTTDWVLTRNACNFRKKYFSRTVSRAWNRPPKPKVENRKSWHRTGKMKFLTLNPCFDRK